MRKHTQERVQQCSEMFGANRGKTNDSNAIVLSNVWSEIRAAVCGNPVAPSGQAAADMLATGFHSAVFANYAAAADEGNAQRL